MDDDLTGFFNRYRHERAKHQALTDIITRMEAIVAAVDDMNAAMAALTTQVNDAVAAIDAQGLTTTEAQGFVADLNNLAAQIQGALNPPAPA